MMSARLSLSLAAGVCMTLSAGVCHGFEDRPEFKALLSKMCRTSPQLQVQRLEIASLRKEFEYTSGQAWYPEVTLSAGPQYYEGESVGNFAFEQNQSAFIDSDNETSVSGRRTGFVNQAKVALDAPIYRNSRWVGQETDDAAILRQRIEYETAKHQKLFQESLLELVEVLVSLQQAQQQEILLRELLTDAQSQLDIARNAARARLIERSDLLEAEGAVAELEGELQQTANNRDYLSQKFAFLAQTADAMPTPDFKLESLPPAGDLEPLVNAAENSSIDVILQQTQLAIARRQYDQARHDNGVAFGLSGSVRGVADEDFSESKHLTTVGVSLEVKLQDTLRASGKSRYWALQVEKEQRQLDLIRANQRIVTLQNYRDYQQQLLTLKNSLSALDRARSELEKNQELFRLGKVGVSEVIESRSDIRQIELGKLDAYAKLWLLQFRLTPGARWSCSVEGD
ncbi:TolC family protein [Hahella sp. NBU794]|uniref:TolC family protein n=1 Tax=Hahella sp. NBU794 TaxID=3422590 RepID=UPI003D6F2D70